MAPLAPEATTGRATWRMSNAGRSRIGCLHCQLICLPSVNSHLKNKTEKECKGGVEEEVEEWSRGGRGEAERACVVAITRIPHIPLRGWPTKIFLRKPQ